MDDSAVRVETPLQRLLVEQALALAEVSEQAADGAPDGPAGLRRAGVGRGLRDPVAAQGERARPGRPGGPERPGRQGRVGLGPGDRAVPGAARVIDLYHASEHPAASRATHGEGAESTA